MVVAKKGDTVKVHYTGHLENGDIFDTSDGKSPLNFIIGQREVIKGFDEAVEGMIVGEKKTVTIKPEKAYGEIKDSLIQTLKRTEMPEDLRYSVGNQIEITNADGSMLYVMVKEITDTEVTLDANHPLAGQSLTFDISMEEIITAEKQKEGISGMMMEQLKERRNMN